MTLDMVVQARSDTNPLTMITEICMTGLAIAGANVWLELGVS